MPQNHTPDHNKSKPDSQERTQLTAGGTPMAGEFKCGDVIGGTYQVLRWIGAGGMGNVYCVRHTIMQKDYALKTLSADKVTDVAWRRFQNEAQAIARMSHPNIVGIYNLGLHDGRLPYYVMDLLKGKTLMDVLKDQGPMEVNLALSLFVELSSGFGYAHKKGIVHRDIKPPNLVLLEVPESTCRVKIVDFGIAKLSGIKDPKNQYLTNVGEVCGSPYYMSPEQTEGQRIDARSDIYSLGCTLFEVLTGVPPLRGRSAVDTMLMHQTTAPPTLKAASGGKEFPEMLEQVMATLLAKAPMDRYQTMELVAQDLSTIIAGQQAVINPYAAQSPKQVNLAGGIDKSDRPTAIGRKPEQDLAHRRQYEAGGGEEVEEASKDSRTQLLLIACALVSVVLVVVGGSLWWQSRVTPAPVVAVTKKAIDPNIFLDDTLKSAPEPFTAADNITDRDKRNNNSAALSAKDTKPFAEFRVIRGRSCKVFQFPTDITIGDIYGLAGGEAPAWGEMAFGASELITFEPDSILLKYPHYLARFRPGDINCLKLFGPKATDDLLKVSSKLPGVSKLQLHDCPNITAKSIPVIDKMPSLHAVELGVGAFDTETLSHLTCLKTLANLAFNCKAESDSFLKLIKGSGAVKALALDSSKISRQGFEYVSTLSNLELLSLDSAKFSSADLQVLANLPQLHAIFLSECRIDKDMILSLRKLKNLRQVDLSEGAAYPLPDAQIGSQLPGVRINFKPSMAEALPDSSNQYIK